MNEHWYTCTCIGVIAAWFVAPHCNVWPFPANCCTYGGTVTRGFLVSWLLGYLAFWLFVLMASWLLGSFVGEDGWWKCWLCPFLISLSAIVVLFWWHWSHDSLDRCRWFPFLEIKFKSLCTCMYIYIFWAAQGRWGVQEEEEGGCLYMSTLAIVSWQTKSQRSEVWDILLPLHLT